jgi:dipeptidyl aminopeptidase/acylaminoacyl peptidase
MIKTKLFLVIALFAIIGTACESATDTQSGEQDAVAETVGMPEVNIDELPEIMTPEVLWKLGRVGETQLSPDQTKIVYSVGYYNVDDNKGNRNIYIMDLASKEVTQLTAENGSEYNPRWRPDGKKIGYLYQGQIWEMDIDGNNKAQVSDFEEGIGGFTYAPDQNSVIYIQDVKLDKTPTEIHTDLPKANARMYDDLMYRHWDDWHDYKYSHVFYANYTDGKVAIGKDIMEGEKFDTPMKPWGGMEQITFSPDAKKIAYVCKKLSGKEYAENTNSEIYVYDIATGTTENITKEGFEGYDHDPVYSPDGKYIAWKSMATNGFEADKERIIIRNLEDGTTVDYSEGFDQSSKHFVWNEDASKMYFISGHHATYQIYVMDMATKEKKAVTAGDHNYNNFLLGKDFIIGEKMNMIHPTEIFKVDFDGNEEQISFTNKEILDHLKPAKFEKRWVKTTDDKEMLTWVIYPPDFDPNKKYPTLLYCQGGPQSAVSQFFSFRWNFQIMASNGYIVVAPNRRGLPTFGQEWNDQISGDYGGQNMKDYLSAIDDVAKESYVDKDNLGAVGASYGGYSVYWLAGNHEGRFSAFISHCGIFEFTSMYGSTEEMFFVNHDYKGAYWDTPKPKSYDFSPHNFVGNWDTPILVIAGEYDFRIPYTQSMQAFNAAQLRGIPSRFLLFPDETHFVLKPQNAILWQREFKRFLDENLKN